MSILEITRPAAEQAESPLVAERVAVRASVGEARAPRGARVVRVLGRVGRLVVSGLLVVSGVAFLFLAVGPHVLGYRTSTMLTGSMAPGIVPGDVVVTMPRPAQDVAVGDVISYRIPIEDQRVETHRVVEVIRGEDGSVAVKTQGDANENIDPWVATIEGDTVWEVQAVVPGVGEVIRALRTPVVQHGVLWVALAGVVGLGISSIWSGTSTGTDTGAKRSRGGARRAR